MFDPSTGTFVPTPRPSGLTRRAMLRAVGVGALATPLVVALGSAGASGAPLAAGAGAGADAGAAPECAADLVSAGAS